jgi:hypothetical protein
LRQRPRVHLAGAPRLVPLQRHDYRLHRTRSTLAESLRRILQRPPTPRTARPREASTPSSRHSCSSTTGDSSTTTTDPTNPSTT